MKKLTPTVIKVTQAELNWRKSLGVFDDTDNGICEQCGKVTEELSQSRDYVWRCIPCNWRLPAKEIAYNEA